MKTIAKLVLIPMLIVLTAQVALALPPSIPMPRDSTPPSLDPADDGSTPPSLDPAVDPVVVPIVDPDPTPAGGGTVNTGGGGIILNNKSKDSNNDGVIDDKDYFFSEGVPYQDVDDTTTGQATPKTGPEVLFVLIPGLLASYGANRYLATKKGK